MPDFPAFLDVPYYGQVGKGAMSTITTVALPA